MAPSLQMMAAATLCAPPSRPPHPLTPDATELSRTEVLLTWEDPDFSGAPPTEYEVVSSGNLRNNSEWAPVFPPGYPAITSSPIRIHRRVPGLALRYRIRGRNHGGWGEYSYPTKLLATSAWVEKTSIPREISTLLRQVSGGPRLVLARMKRYPSSIATQEHGFSQLVSYINKKELGLPRVSLAKEVVLVVSEAMSTFSQSRSIQSSGLILLGWATKEKGGQAARGEDGSGATSAISEDLIDRCLALVSKAKTLHSMDPSVTGHASWAEGNL
ncbi:unnamed protein product, partial [Choristocarpus tenellus]